MTNRSEQCRPSDIRWVAIRPSPEGRDERLIYYFVDGDGNSTQVDEVAIGSDGDPYRSPYAYCWYCIPCVEPFSYWQDVKEHLQPPEPTSEGGDNYWR